MKKMFLLILILFHGSLFSASDGQLRPDEITNLCSWVEYAYSELYRNAEIDWHNIVSTNVSVAKVVQGLNAQLIQSGADKERFVSDNAGHLIAFMKNIEASNSKTEFQCDSIVFRRVNPTQLAHQAISIVDAICCNILINFIQNKDIDIFSKVCADAGDMFGLKNMVIALIRSINSKKTCMTCGRDYCTANRGSANDKNIDYSLYLIIKAIDESRINAGNMCNVRSDISSELGFFQTIDKLIRLARMQVGRGFGLSDSDNKWIYDLVKFLFEQKRKDISLLLSELNSHETGYQEDDKLVVVNDSQKAIDEELYQAAIDNWQEQGSFEKIMRPLVKQLGDKAGKDAYIAARISSKVNGILVTPFLQYYFKNLKFDDDVVPDQYKPYIERFFNKILKAGQFAADFVARGVFTKLNFKNEIEADIEEHGKELIRFFTRPNRQESENQFSTFYAFTRAKNNQLIKNIKDIDGDVGKYVENRLTEYIDELFEIAEKARKDTNETASEKKPAADKESSPATAPKLQKAPVPTPQAKPGLVALATSLSVLFPE